MSDLARDAAVALFSLAFLSGLAHDRAREAARRHARTFLEGGAIAVQVRPQGEFGLLVGRASEVTVRAEGVRMVRIPLSAEPSHGTTARIGKLRFDLVNSTFLDLPVRHFRADIPSVSVDPMAAFWDLRVILRNAKPGRVEVAVGAEGIRSFLARRYPALHDVDVDLAGGLVRVAATTPVLGFDTRIIAEGHPAIRDGRYLVLCDMSVHMNGRLLDSGTAKTFAMGFDPLLDVERDLGTGQSLKLDDVAAANGSLTVRGSISVPVITRSKGLP